MANAVLEPSSATEMAPEAAADERSAVLSVIDENFEFVRGSPLPLGATVLRGGINFSIVSKPATEVTLVIFSPQRAQQLLEFPLNPTFHKTGDIWHCFLAGLDPGIHYAYRINGSLVLDPYGKAVWGRRHWGKRPDTELRSVVVEDRFQWDHDQPLGIPLSDSVIYELHVRGFTRDSSSCVSDPGTFLGLTGKIPYLKRLGITAVELLPVTEFNERENPRCNPATGNPLFDYWGYNPLAFFAPKTSYSTATTSLSPVTEFKQMVKEFHAAGIEVILDVVFNHTGEGGEGGPTVSWKGIDGDAYYLKTEDGKYRDYSGCGNTLNCNHPMVRNHILDCLHYWVTEMHVDGFRFDLASVLGRGRDGSVLANPPVLEQIAADPVLSKTKLIAEAWDAAGLYQVGSFPAWGRWAEWNGRFRDDIRKFVKGDPGMVPVLATRLAGSADLYQGSGRAPFHSINFVTCHDGFTLADLVAFNHKHNEANGEDNRDGSNENESWNCGAEGATADTEVQALRQRQTRNLAALLLIAHGTPMILAGDELGHSQHGNNNAYCQDGAASWIDWNQETGNRALVEYFRKLIAFRRHHAILRRTEFVSRGVEPGTILNWHGQDLWRPDWSPESRLLALHLQPGRPDSEDQIYVIANAHWEARACELPQITGLTWLRFLDTSLEEPDLIAEPGAEFPIGPGKYLAGPRSVAILIGRTNRKC